MLSCHAHANPNIFLELGFFICGQDDYFRMLINGYTQLSLDVIPGSVLHDLREEVCRIVRADIIAGQLNSWIFYIRCCHKKRNVIRHFCFMCAPLTQQKCTTLT